MDIKSLENRIKTDENGQFSLFKEMLKEYNQRYNLTAVTDDEGIFYKHFLDSAAGEEYFFKGACVAEVGSGAGFPSVPLKILRPDLKFTLIESTKKKCDFLAAVCGKLNFKDMEIKNIRAEDGAGDIALREKFDVCCARAVARLNTLAEYCLPYVKKGGLFIAYKGDCAEELEEAKNAIRILGGNVKEVKTFALENCGKRSLIIVEKVAPTPVKYPRGRGLERKVPLK